MGFLPQIQTSCLIWSSQGCKTFHFRGTCHQHPSCWTNHHLECRSSPLWNPLFACTSFLSIWKKTFLWLDRLSLLTLFSSPKRRIGRVSTCCTVGQRRVRLFAFQIPSTRRFIYQTPTHLDDNKAGWCRQHCWHRYSKEELLRRKQ
jgi:hypothetical protein